MLKIAESYFKGDKAHLLLVYGKKKQATMKGLRIKWNPKRASRRGRRKRSPLLIKLIFTTKSRDIGRRIARVILHL